MRWYWGTDKSVIVENAQRLAAQGQYEHAIVEWKKLRSGQPTDSIIYNTIGDLHLKRRAPAEAVDAYFQAAAAFRAEGSGLKAIAVYRKILKVDPARYQVYRDLGDLNAERGLISNAISDYLTLTKRCLKEGRTQEAIELYRTIATLDASNAEARQRLAEFSPMSSAQGEPAMQPATTRDQAATAIESPTPASASPPAEEPHARKVISRLIVLEGAVQKIREGEYTEAEAALTDLLNQVPGDPEVCRLLALLHLKRGELAVAKAEFQFLAEAAMRAKEYELAESMLDEYLRTEPTCVPLLEMLGRVYQQKGNRASAVAQYGKALALLVENPAPDNPTLPAELYANIKSLDSDSAFVNRFAPVFEPTDPRQEALSVPEPAKPAQPSEQDYETRYQLGVAFKHTDLLNEAIEEFRVAVNGTAQFLEAYRMLTACMKEQGRNKEAIAAMEQALADSRCVGDTAVSVRYELGKLYEAEGLSDNAVRVFSTITSLIYLPMRLK
ncbi:MAG: tetratricopeptide repeat protein, partial [Nitrospiraceae bacterium]